MFRHDNSKMFLKLIRTSFRRCSPSKRLAVLVIIIIITIISFTNWDAAFIFFGFKVRNTAPITWSDPTARYILVNDTLSKQLAKKIRILCIVPSSASHEKTKMLAVTNTWGARCTNLLFALTRQHSSFPHVSLNVTDGRSHLTAKTMEGFRYVHKHYSDQFDWVIKADDDSYLIMENLRFLLSKFEPNEPAYLGYHFKTLVHNGYMSGGGSYVLSKEALRLMVEVGLADNGKCARDSADEDVEVGRCMELLGVKPYVTYDKFGRDSFHPNSLHQNIVGPLSWYLKDYPAKQAQTGPECCSQFSVSFHYVPPEMMYVIEMLLYRVSVYGTHHLPASALDDVFSKRAAKIEHKSKDEIIPIKKYFAAPNYVPQEHQNEER